MLRQVKLLSLIGFVLANSSLQGGIEAPFNYVESLIRRPKDLAMIACAAVMGNVAYSLSQREYTEKGEYRTIGDTEVDPLIAEIAYCAAAGTGLAAIENLGTDGNANLSFNNRLSAATVNTICMFGTDLVAKQDIYQSLDRNHPLFRGWLPFNVKFDDLVKRLVVFGALRTALKTVQAKTMTIVS
jgi:hypothetical protein